MSRASSIVQKLTEANYLTSLQISGLSAEDTEKLIDAFDADSTTTSDTSVRVDHKGGLVITAPWSADDDGQKSRKLITRWQDIVNKSGVKKSGMVADFKKYMKEESERKWVGAVKEANGRVHYANAEGKPATKPFLFDTKMEAEKMAKKLKKDHPLWVEVIVAPQDTDLGGVSKKVSRHKFTK